MWCGEGATVSDALVTHSYFGASQEPERAGALHFNNRGNVMSIRDREYPHEAAARRRKDKAEADRRPDSEFVNRELDTEEIKGYRLWREDAGTVFEELDNALEAGYKISIKYDDYSASPCVFLFPSGDNENAGKILTGRGGTAFRALAECLYKHAVVFRGSWNWSRRAGNSGRDEGW